MPATLLQVAFFVHPALAGAAVAAGAVPILIHLINRRRYARVPWAAMAFLLAANRRSIKRVRLEQWLLMLARVAIIVLFGLALARPYFSNAFIFSSSSSRTLRVVVFDNSLSMNARGDAGVSRFERAREQAMALLDAFPPADPVVLITAAAPAESVLAQPSFDRRFVREQLLAIQPTQRVADVAGGLSLATSIIDDQQAGYVSSRFPPTNRAIYVISDFPQRVWQSEQPGQPTPTVSALRRLTQSVADPNENVTLIPVSGSENQNVAVTSLAAESSLIAVDRPVRFAIAITNFGTSVQKGLTLQVLKDGELIRREPLPALEPGQTRSVAIATLFGLPGTQVIEATVAGMTDDALTEDNARYLCVEVRDRVPVLLVDGRPGLSRLAGQAGFLATALAPKASDTDAVVLDPIIVTPPELATEALAGYGMIALCNVNRLAPEIWTELRAYVDGGGGLLVFLGELVDTDHYNEFGFDGGAGLMPGSISTAQRVQQAGYVSDRADGELHIAYDALHHPVVRDFDGHPQSGLFSANILAYLPMDVDRRRAETVLHYTNGQPAVVAFASAKKKVVVVTTTANMDWSNLPAKGDYVSLISNLAAHLVRQKGNQRNLVVGQFIHEPLTARQSSMPLRVSFPAVRRSNGPVLPGSHPPSRASSALVESAIPTLVPHQQSLALSYGPVNRAGAVTVSIGAAKRLFAVNVETSESALAALDPSALASGLGFPVHVMAHTDANGPALLPTGLSDTAPTLLYIVMALLLLEMWMATRFGAARGSVAPAARRNAEAR